MKNRSNKDWESIESEWKEKIQEEIAPVPEGFWEKLSVRLDAEEKPKVFFIKAWPWAALLAIAIGLGWQWFLPQGEEVIWRTNTAKIATRGAFIQPKATIHRNQILKTRPPEENQVIRFIKQKPNQLNHSILPTIEKTVIEDPVVPEKGDVIVQQNPPALSDKVVENEGKKEEAIWVQVKIDPISPADEERPILTRNSEQKKRNFGQFLKKIKQVIKGNPGEWSEIKENFHLVANKYVQTEETIKQKIQFQ